MTPERIAALGAFLSGIGAAISAVVGSRKARQRCEEDCAKRFEALREGLRIAHEEDRRDAP